MSRRRLKGDAELIMVVFALFIGLAFILLSQILTTTGILISKKNIQVNMYVDDRGTELVSLLKSTENGMVTMYVLGSLAAEGYEEYLGYLQMIEERIDEMSLTHELIVSGNSLSYYTGRATGKQVPAYAQLSTQTCGLPPPPDIGIKIGWPGSGKRITSGFGYRELQEGCDCHGGIDIGGETIDAYAVADGVVVSVYPDPDEGEELCGQVSNCMRSYVAACDCNDGYGNMIVIEHEFNGKKYRSYYYHLRSIESGIKAGSLVKAGDLIGKSGNTGFSEAPHLHYELRGEPYASDADSINPCNLFETRDWSGDCTHEFPDVCKSFRVYGAYIPIPGAQPGNVKTEVSLRAW